MKLGDLTGLQILEKIIDGTIPPPSMANTMSLILTSVKEGYAEFKAIAGDRHLNPMGTVHGGFAATVLDSVTGCAVHTLLQPGESYGTVDLNVKLLKPVPKDKKLTAEARCIHLSKRLGVSEGTLKDDDGILYAHATATCMISRKNGD